MGRTSDQVDSPHLDRLNKWLTHQVSKEQSLRTQNVSFSEPQNSWSLAVESEPDSTFAQTDMADADLAHFLSRPVKLSSWNWAVGSPLNFTFDPWTEFFANPRVVNRLSNFYLLRCTLHVKFVMLGSNFHYGRALAHYRPLDKFDQFESQGSPQVFSANLVRYTQRPSVFLDPTGTSGGTLILPFVHPASNLVVPAGEWQTMGQLAFSTFTSLKHANGGLDPVNISIYAWAEDVHLSIPTSAPPFGLVPQMGMLDSWKNDEYNGMISGPAAIVEHMAGKFRKAPYIGRYAVATQNVAHAAGSLARFFGFSRPTMPEQSILCTELPFGNITNTNIHDHSVKLTLDSKQETTIDPRVMGLGGTDEMTIKSIVTRESYLTRFVWPTGGANDAVIWSCNVVPNLFAIDSGDVGIPPAYHLTPICFGTLPFKYWRGTIKFRFLVCASPYHKGKLAIRYDPRAFASTEYNTNYTHILDIEKDQDFTIEVGWSQGLNYQEVTPLTPGAVTEYGPTRRLVRPDTNGVVEINVHNGLTSPNSVVNNDLTVLVFVSAGDDFEVCGPDDTSLRNIVYFPQMGEDTMNADEETGDPEESHVKYTISSVTHNPHMLAIHDGDPILSFRQCLKRYQLSTVWSLGTTANDWALWVLNTSDFPLYRGRAPNAIEDYTTGTPPIAGRTNFANTTLLHYLTPAYVCRRGGLRRMYVLPESTNPIYGGLTSVNRAMQQVSHSLSAVGLPPNVTSTVALRKLLLNTLPSFWKGSHLISSVAKNTISVELPYHNNRRFAPAKRADFTNPSQGLTSHTLTSTIRCDVSSRSAVLDFVSIAEDFQLAFYTGPPRIWLAAPSLSPSG